MLHTVLSCWHWIVGAGLIYTTLPVPRRRIRRWTTLPVPRRHL